MMHGQLSWLGYGRDTIQYSSGGWLLLELLQQSMTDLEVCQELVIAGLPHIYCCLASMCLPGVLLMPAKLI
jgi:hypothetical protein